MIKVDFRAEPDRHDATYEAILDAPKAAIHRAHIEPALVRRWWSPPELETRIETYDARTGGSWRIINIDPNGGEYAFRGVFHEVSDERISQTWEFEMMPGHVSLQTVTFEEVEDGRTRVHTHVVCQSVADRDGLKDSGMEAFAPVGLQQLEDVAKSL